MTGNQTIVALELQEASFARPETQRERDTAIADLLAGNHFAPFDEDSGEAYQGPFSVRIRLREQRVCLDVQSETGVPLTQITLPMAPFRGVVRDYFLICDSYFEAVKTGDAMRVEAIDMGRRGIHNEGAELLRDVLSPRVTVDFDTARRLFTLITALHLR
jgi:uncharacterized protein (UPF0262 family)